MTRRSSRSSWRARARTREGMPRKPAIPRLVTIAIPGLIALGGLIASVSLAQRDHPKARIVRSGPTAPPGGARLRYGAAIRGTCLTVDRSQRNEMRGWGVYTFDPCRDPVIGPAHRRLLPGRFAAGSNPPGLDAFASGSIRPADLSDWQVSGVGRQLPANPEARCATSLAVAAPDASAARSSIVLRRPGPYVYWTFDHTVRWVRVGNSAAEPTPHPCPQVPDQSASSPAPTGSPPSVGGSTWHWAVSSFCTTVRWWTFSVLGLPGSCSRASSDYINQYAAGARLHLPLGRGKAGGNACGPSALLMAMRASRRRASQRHGASASPLPDLPRVFDETMALRRARVRPDRANEFIGSKAGVLLRQLGWSQAAMGRLGTSADNIVNETTDSDSDPSNQAVIDHALDHGPVVISTDLGTEPWGQTGDGHMIVVLGRDPANPGEYIVYDPAGNYFSDPVDHYGPSSCGSGVLYPRSWLLAYTTGSWYLSLGAPPGRATT